MLIVSELLEALRLMPPDAAVEVWYPADARGAYDVEVDVKLQLIHDHEPVAIAIIAARPTCSNGAEDPTAERCWARADVELTDRTGHRHSLCGPHAAVVWDGDPNTRVSVVYGGPGGLGWAIAARLLERRWGEDPDIAAWAAHPAPWLVPLPHQPFELRAS